MYLPPRRTRVPLLFALAIVLAGCAVLQAQRPATAGKRDVKVKVKCRGDKLDVSVDPFAVPLSAGESVAWVADGGSLWSGRNDVEVKIVPREPASWPFDAPPPTIPIEGEAPSGQLTSAAARTVKYNLVFTCELGGVMREVVIDPDIIISGGIVR
jgi:hypothetical protein